MRHWLFFLVAALVLPFCVVGQRVVESELSLRKKYAPLTGSKSSVLNMELTRNWDVGGRDTVFYFLITVSEVEREVTGMSFGVSAFSLGLLGGGGSSADVQMKYNKAAGSVSLGQAEFLEFYGCVNDVYRMVVNIAGGYAGSKDRSTLCYCGVDGVEFAGEHLVSGLDRQRFYFRLGDAAFSMTKADFEEIVKLVRDAKGFMTGRP